MNGFHTSKHLTKRAIFAGLIGQLYVTTSLVRKRQRRNVRDLGWICVESSISLYVACRAGLSMCFQKCFHRTTENPRSLFGLKPHGNVAAQTGWRASSERFIKRGFQDIFSLTHEVPAPFQDRFGTFKNLSGSWGKLLNHNFSFLVYQVTIGWTP